MSNLVNYVVLFVFVFTVFFVWQYFYNKNRNFVERKEHDQRFPVKDKHLKIWRD